MKKIISGVLFLVVMMFSFSACGKTDTKCSPDLNKTFCVKAEIKYEDEISETKFKRISKGNWDVEFSSPETLAGVLLSFRDSDVSASYKGLSFSVPKSAMPIKSIITGFIDIVDNMTEIDEIEAEENEGNFEIDGETELGEYTLTLDNNGCLYSFEMDNLNVIITFTDTADSVDCTDITSSEITDITSETTVTTVS